MHSGSVRCRCARRCTDWASSGALTIMAGRSVGIPALSVARLEDLRRVRIEVEGLAAAWAAANVTPELLSKLDTLIERMEGFTNSVECKAFVPANREFHFAIYRAAASESLLAVIEPLWLQIGPYLALLRGSGNWRTANCQHRRTRDALARGDGIAAREALRADINEAAAVLADLNSDLNWPTVVMRVPSGEGRLALSAGTMNTR